MDLSIFPTTASGVFTVAGAAIICVLVVQWLKGYVTDSRWYNLAGLLITFAIVEVAGMFLVETASAGERLFIGFLVALAGASMATFGWETITNLAGKAGVGPRAALTK